MVEFSSVIFDMFMLPFEKKGLSSVRKRLLKNARGNVLEIGAGTGANLRYYNHNKVKSLTIIDIDITESLRKRVEENCSFPVKLIKGSAEEMPFSPQSFDTVVVTLVLCSISDVQRALNEVRGVLKDDGNVIFIEHVISTKSSYAKIQNALNTPWRAVSGGCNLNRDTKAIIEKSGFKILELKSFWSDIFISGIAEKHKTLS